jgi:hypothetical protein
VSSKTFKNTGYIGAKRLTSASATAQMGAPVALRLTMLTTLKHPMQLSDTSRGLTSRDLFCIDSRIQFAEKFWMFFLRRGHPYIVEMAVRFVRYGAASCKIQPINILKMNKNINLAVIYQPSSTGRKPPALCIVRYVLKT